MGALHGIVEWSRANASLAVAALILLPIILFAAVGPSVMPYSPYDMTLGAELVSPSRHHLLGTDELGRDILSRVAIGIRLSMVAAGVVVLCGGIVGVIVGELAGYVGGRLDDTIMRAVDALLAIPPVLLGIATAAALGPSQVTITLALIIVAVPQFARIARALVLAERNMEYVQAARCIGCSSFRILFLHILRNTTSPLVIQASWSLAMAILLEAGLSFLGLGAHPPDVSLGLMLSISRQYLFIAPWYSIAPGVVLTMMIVGVNYVADGLRDVLDPSRLR